MMKKTPILAIAAIMISGLILYQLGIFILSLTISSQEKALPTGAETTFSSATAPVNSTPATWKQYQGKNFAVDYETNWVVTTPDNTSISDSASQIVEAIAWKDPVMNNPVVQIYVTTATDQNIYTILNNCQTPQLTCITINGQQWAQLNINYDQKVASFVTTKNSLVFMVIVNVNELDSSVQSHIIQSLKV